MRVKLEFLWEGTGLPRPTIEKNVEEFTIEFQRLRETGIISDIGVELKGSTHFGVYRITIAEEAE